MIIFLSEVRKYIISTGLGLFGVFAAVAHADDPVFHLLDFRLSQISMFQNSGNCLSGGASWNPRFSLLGGLEAGANLGFTALRYLGDSPSPVLEYQVAAGFVPKSGVGLELVAGRQRWFSGPRTFDVFGGNVVYTFENAWLKTVNRLVLGYEGLTMDSVYTNVVKIGVGLSFGSFSSSKSPNSEDAKPVSEKPAPVVWSSPAVPVVSAAPTASKTCAGAPYYSTAFVRKLNARERARLKTLPYYIKSRNHAGLDTLQIGQASGHTRGGVSFVQGAQVIFAMDLLDLPSRSLAPKVVKAVLKMRVNRISQDTASAKGMLCLVGEKICSGELREDLQTQGVLNPRFFEYGKGPRNDFFASQLSDPRPGMSGARELELIDLILPLDRLLESSGLQTLDVLYGNDSANGSGRKRTLYFAVSHDIFVTQETRLELSLDVAGCEK